MNLLNAASQGSTKKVKKLLMAGVPYDWQSPTGHTPLIAAAERCHHTVVGLLLSKGSNVNQAKVLHGTLVGHDGVATTGVASAVYRTPLDRVALNVVELLLAKGADVNNAQESGSTPLSWRPRWDTLPFLSCYCPGETTSTLLKQVVTLH